MAVHVLSECVRISWPFIFRRFWLVQAVDEVMQQLEAKEKELEDVKEKNQYACAVLVWCMHIPEFVFSVFVMTGANVKSL